MDIRNFNAPPDELETLQSETVGDLFDEVWAAISEAEEATLDEFLAEMEYVRNISIAEALLIRPVHAEIVMDSEMLQDSPKGWCQQDIAREVAVARRRSRRAEAAG